MTNDHTRRLAPSTGVPVPNWPASRHSSARLESQEASATSRQEEKPYCSESPDPLSDRRTLYALINVLRYQHLHVYAYLPPQGVLCKA